MVKHASHEPSHLRLGMTRKIAGVAPLTGFQNVFRTAFARLCNRYICAGRDSPFVSLAYTVYALRESIRAIMTMGEETCVLQKRGNVFVLMMNGNGEHRLSIRYMDSMISALAQVNHRSHEASALITTNEGKFFSNGFDLDWASAGLDDKETRLQQLTTKLMELLKAVLSLKLPTIAAVCGHAPAGAFIFALAHDYIFMRKDRGFLYMSEVDLGFIIPPDIMSVIRSKLNARQLREVVLAGRKFTAQMALDEGIIDSAHDSSAQTLEAAMGLATRLGERNWNRDVYLALRLRIFPEATEMLHPEEGRPLSSRL